MKKNDPRSLLMLTLSMVIFGSIGIFRRAIPLPSAVLACYRGAVGAILLAAAAKAGKKKLWHHIGAKKIIALCAAGAMMGFNWILLFEAYNFTTVQTATLCYYMQPTIVILLSPLVFRERMTPKKGLCVLLALLGMIFVSGIVEKGVPDLSESRGILFGLGAAVLYAGVVIMNKKLPGLDAYEKTVIQLMAAAAALIPYLLISPQKIGMEWTAEAAAMLLIVGVIHTCAAYALYFGSMDGLKAQTVAMFSYLDPIVALVLSAVLLGESMTVIGIIGAALILGAAFLGEIVPERHKTESWKTGKGEKTD